MTVHGSGTQTQPLDSDSHHTEELNQLFTDLIEQLHERARMEMGNSGPGHTLQPTALISEAYLRMEKSENLHWQDRSHFMVVASKVMRSVLVDHYRSKNTIKRSKGRAEVELDMLAQGYEENDIDLEALDLALEKLDRSNPVMARAVQLRLFAGLRMAEIARILGVPMRTFERHWKIVLAWLQAELA